MLTVPTLGSLKVAGSELKVLVNDITGKLVSEFNASQEAGTVSFKLDGGLAPGIYFATALEKQSWGWHKKASFKFAVVK